MAFQLSSYTRQRRAIFLFFRPHLILLITLYDVLIYDTISIILYKYTNKLIKAKLFLTMNSLAFTLCK